MFGSLRHNSIKYFIRAHLVHVRETVHIGLCNYYLLSLVRATHDILKWIFRPHWNTNDAYPICVFQQSRLHLAYLLVVVKTYDVECRDPSFNERRAYHAIHVICPF